ncbi:NAD-dependent aldehyde dehydrogenase [Xenococcus sp. PCC 7305]|uniref:aldehyde dehydrogenase family protein n=1 Tax=Xenococcus sp. PCC 7305 TaxID=102125 RepID=UPI0002AC6F11|nr:aldehyde dehydrogenase family protein [Xenococcus sp. PCC 7305]ELS01900.1 NAD-dependent aldehyde dehydrogenase [Xenococcus sp. PCC 7305]
MNEQILQVRNPRSLKVDYWIHPLTSLELRAKCDRLRESQTAWQQLGIAGRIKALQDWKQALIEHKDELIESLIQDTGRYSETLIEFDSVISGIDRWCRLAPELLSTEPDKTTAISFIQLQQQLVPYTLVGVISPWNFPLLLSTIDTIPALLAGCAVIAKPSEIAPRFIAPLTKTINSVPELSNVLLYIEGAGDIGADLISEVDLVCFTGSVATGKKVAAAAAARFIPAFLELGGKDPAIVLASADLDLASSAILWGSVINSGQSCLSIERIYVAASIFDDFVEQLVSKAKKLKLNYPVTESGEIGPIIAQQQAKIITEHLEDAIAKGAKIHCGGAVAELAGGLWCPPTVLTKVNHDMKIMSEETFAPIMPIMPFASNEEAISLANDTCYGLSAAVFAGSETEAISVAEGLDAGAISINDAGLTAFIHEAEKNAFKFSGIGGSRMGAAALKRFMRKKAFLIKTQSFADPWWFDPI